MTEMNHTGYLLKTTTELQPLDLGQYFMEMSSNLSLEYIPRDYLGSPFQNIAFTA